MYDLSLLVVAGLIDSGETQGQTSINSCKTRTCGLAIVRVRLMNQEAEASNSGSGSGETMQKNDQGDEYLKVSHSPSEIFVG